MSDGNIRQVLAGQKPLVVGHGGSMFELGSQDILVRAIFPGPLKTRAASALEDFELLLNESAQEAPLGKPVDIIDAGFAYAYLATSLASRVTGGTVYVDGGAHIVA